MALLGGLGRPFQRRYRPNDAYLSFAQEGEDMVLRSILMNRPRGFYVDVGAHHPTRYSNTSWFYAAGWSGINIEANPSLLDAFHKQRPRDINLACGVGSEETDVEFYVFNEQAVNTFDPVLAQRRTRSANEWHIVETKQVSVRRLDSLLDEHLPASTRLDFLTVDAEGRDLDVLNSNDWDRYPPTYVLAETQAANLSAVASDPVTALLVSVGYTAIAKTFSTVVYKRDADPFEPGRNRA